MTQKKFLRFTYAGIKRYGEKKFIAIKGCIEFNPNYTVSCGQCEIPELNDGLNHAFVCELSNGTKFLCYLHNYGTGDNDEVLSESGEVANSYADPSSYAKAERLIYKLNQSR